MTVSASWTVWALWLHVGAAGSMATVGSINLQWWCQDRSERSLASTGLLCWSVALTLLIGAVGLSFQHPEVFRVVVPVRAVLIGVTAALLLTTLGVLVRLPALRAAVVAVMALPLTYATLGVTGDAAYVFINGSPWAQIQPLGHALIGGSVVLFTVYAALAWARLQGAHRHEWAGVTISVLGVLTVPLVAGPGALTEAMTSLWTLPIAMLLAWWCSARVLTLQGSLVSAEAGWKEAEKVARYQARHDLLTGLSNRDGAAEALQCLLDAADSETLVVVTKFRVSRLEHVRALAGSQSADLVLRAIAGHLVDTLLANAEVARVGETTFVVMDSMPVGSSLEELKAEAEQAVTLLRRSTDLPRDLVFSVGIAVSHPGSTADQLLQEAGTAVMAAQQGPGDVQLYRPELKEQMLDRARTTRLLTVAVDRDELELHYQPVLDATSLARVGVEALVRWRHHGRLHPPAEWIPVAEQQGLMPAIGLHVLRLAARDYASIACPIAVNVSARQLADPDFTAGVLDALIDIPPHAIVLEITESSAMADLAQACSVLATLRQHGLRIAIDDFGTEYSSLSRLALVPFDILKIDRSFVSRVQTPEGRAIVTAIHAMARALGKTTVAEGIETREQLQALTEIGCDRVQGFLTGRPVPLDELLADTPSSTSVPGVSSTREQPYREFGSGQS